MRIDRMLGITIILLGRGKVTARELAERFEVSVRTIYRDIEAIQGAGIPVVCLSGRGGGYTIMENYTIDKRLLTFEDMASILTALKGVSATFGDPDTELTFDKISSLVPQDKTTEMDRRLERLVIDYSPWSASEKLRRQFDLINRAISENELLEITYRNLKGETSTRAIEPMTLLFKGMTWYLYAFCRMQSDFRLFRLSRILHIKEPGRSFQRREGTYRTIWDTYNPAAPQVHLVLSFSPEIRPRVEEFFGEENVVELNNGRLLVKTTWPEDEWVYATLLGFGEHLEVFEPPHIRRILYEKAAQISDIYKTKADIVVSQS